MNDIDPKIVSALERVTQIMRALAWEKAKVLSLNPVQVQILLFLLYHQHNDYSVTGLAREFTISKASISDTIRSLEEKRMIRKKYNAGTVKNFTIVLTPEGRKAAENAVLYSGPLLAAIERQTEECKNIFFTVLGELLYDLRTNGVGPIQRICQTCDYHGDIGGKHYCALLDKNLRASELQIDCDDHKSIVG